MEVIANLAYSSTWAGAAGLALAALLYFSIRRQPEGSLAMRDIAAQIHTGSMTFLRREYSVVIPFLIVIAALLYWAVGAGTAIAYAGGAFAR